MNRKSVKRARTPKVKIATRICVPITKLRKKPANIMLFFVGVLTKSTIKNKASNKKEKAKKFGFPPQVIISVLLMKKAKSPVAIAAVILLSPASFFAKKKNGNTTIEKTSAAPTFNAVNASNAPINPSSNTKYNG